MTMDFIPLGKSDLLSSRFIYGCMRIAGSGNSADIKKGKLAIHTAIEQGFNHFDHADIYGAGHSELIFAQVLQQLLRENPNIREQIIITSKTGIGLEQTEQGWPKRYDLSKAYLLNSVDGILQRLGIDQLDCLLLHRPDFLMDAVEVAETFSILKASGKVKHFGVSNFTPSQVTMLQDKLTVPLIANQVEINIHNISTLLDGTLDQCQQYQLSPMAWCPLGGVVYPAWGNTFSDVEQARIQVELTRQAEKYQCQTWQVILAWLLKHPANILPIIGSTTPERIKAATEVFTLAYEREDWYHLLEARNGQPVP